MKKFFVLFLVSLPLMYFGCSSPDKAANTESAATPAAKGTFAYDVDFLKKYHPDFVLLSNADSSAQTIVLPAYQGRVMTSTSNGANGTSYGWLNYDLIASGKIQEHIHAVGGEERFWLGPEGGQFSIYFEKGKEFTFDNWFVPKEIDSQPFDLVSKSVSSAVFRKDMQLANYSGTQFNLRVDRTIKLLSRDSVGAVLNASLPQGVEVVGYQSDNMITNIGATDWKKSSGLLSIWILGMFNATDNAIVLAPYKQGSEAELGKIVTDNYFGKVPADRLQVRDSFMVFKADGNHRSKIGISPERALPWICSYDSQSGVLTIAQFTIPDQHSGYVNSLWELQKEPYKGDAVNSYNDGPMDGKQMGRFYEIESSSPAAELKAGASLLHTHRTIHIKGSQSDIDAILSKAFGITTGDFVFTP